MKREDLCLLITLLSLLSALGITPVLLLVSAVSFMVGRLY
jgi:hypothetical protein